MNLQGAVKVFRRKGAVNPYNPAESVPGDWASADSWLLEGAALLSADAGVVVSGSDRVGAVHAWTLYVDDAGADLRKGDGVARSSGAVMPEFVLDRLPFADRNPFTGWQPVLEVPVREAFG